MRPILRNIIYKVSKNNKILILILLTAAVLRLWGLGSGEFLFDEGLYAFRSIGWLDYLESPFQTTPVQWLADKSDLPGWLKLSFHDHPPLFFLIQYIFFKVFGDSLFVSRLPSAIFGIGFVYLTYLISRNLFARSDLGDFKGQTLIAPLLTAVSFANVSLSRLAMMESALFFFILLNIYCFLRLLENKKYWWRFGLTFGLAMLTKYIAVFLIPTYFIFLLIYQRDLFKNAKIYLALVLALIILSPVIVYNIYSYKTFGHFDLQFSYLLKQKTPWNLNEISGKTMDPFSKIGENLPAVFSIPFLTTALIGLALSCLKFRKELALILITFVFITLLLTQTGSAIRFVSLYVIPATIFITALVIFLWQHWPKPVLIGLILAVITLSELYIFAFNRPDYGVAKLDKYLDSVFKNGRSEVIPAHPNPFLNKTIQKYAADVPVTLKPTGLIYDDNISIPASLWLFSRRQYYHAIPIMTAGNFENILEHENPAAFKNFTLYFVKAGEAAPLKPIKPSGEAEKIEKLLLAKNQKPVAVFTDSSTDFTTFKVYKFSLK